MEQPRIEDRGSHLEVSLSARGFGQENFADVLAAAAKRFGPKPILVICDDPGDAIGAARAYDVELSARLPLSRIAIALTRRKSTSADRLTELVAENRGAAVRYFESVELAKSWLGVS
jgi:hypothetical protein